MKKTVLIIASALALCAGAFAQDKPSSKAPQLKWYGFVRSYFAFDTRESAAGTEELFYYLPKDESIVDGEDVNATSSFRFAALTSRLGLDIVDYEALGYKIGAKIEADFYSGVSGLTGTAQLRLRQAYTTVAKNGRSWKIGQAWHPMAIDLPDIFSLESGAPFGAFSRTPQVLFNTKLNDKLNLDLAALWQMQYTSLGPDGAKADYIRNSCIPELYAGLNLKWEQNLVRLGADMLSIKPRKSDSNGLVDDRITTFNFFQFGQFKTGGFTIKEKITYAEDGSHFNLIGGYGVSKKNADGSWEYTPTRSLSSWATVQYKGKSKWVPSILVGYIKEFGTKDEIVDNFWGKNTPANINQMYRIQPEILYNLGKLSFGLEYMLTSVQYGTPDSYKKATNDLHWVSNNRIQAMVKFTF